MQKFVVIVAGGSGSRMKSEIPKQFLELKDRPIAMRTIERFAHADDKIQFILVLPKTQFAFWEQLVEEYRFEIPVQLVEGGEQRYHSVGNGLKNVPAGSLVAIHDAVRPLVANEVIRNGFLELDKWTGVIPVVPVVESLRKKTTEGHQAVFREDYVIVQTPQFFRTDAIAPLYRQNFDPSFTDDATVAEKGGLSIGLIDGNRENIKITTPADLHIAEALFEPL
jgi:2-C-methyl-D-erythritol 4-phosphate cytidylyltransferase